MYFSGDTGHDINEYTLSTAWHIGTASYTTVSSPVTSDDGGPQGITFKPDGTKMYMMGGNTDTVYEYNLSPAWDISTLSLNASSSASEDNYPGDLFINASGTKMYVPGSYSDRIYEYNLTSAWDITSLSYVHSVRIYDEEPASTAVFLKSDGTKMYVIGFVNDNINDYDLSTAWDVTTASSTLAYSVADRESTATALAFSADGDKMYFGGYAKDIVWQYSVVNAPPDFQSAITASQETDGLSLIHI